MTRRGAYYFVLGRKTEYRSWRLLAPWRRLSVVRVSLCVGVWVGTSSARSAYTVLLSVPSVATRVVRGPWWPQDTAGVWSGGLSPHQEGGEPVGGVGLAPRTSTGQTGFPISC